MTIRTPKPIDLTDERIQVGDTIAFVEKMNRTQEKLENWTSQDWNNFAADVAAVAKKLEEARDSAQESADLVAGAVLQVKDYVEDNFASLGTAATRDVGTATGNVMQVGAFGVGGIAIVGNDFSFNSPSGFYRSNLSPNSTSSHYFTGIYSNYGGATNERGFLVYATEFASGQGRKIRFKTKFDGSESDVEAMHTGNILTTTGQSTEYPMTQKAVTDELSNKAALNATATVQGGIKLRQSGSDVFITTNGSNP